MQAESLEAALKLAARITINAPLASLLPTVESLVESLVPRRTECRLPPEPAGHFSEGGEAIKLHMAGSLKVLTTGIKRV